MSEIVCKQQTLGRPIISSFVTQSLGLESGSTTSGSVAVYARCGAICSSNRFIANFLDNLQVKNFLKIG